MAKNSVLKNLKIKKRLFHKEVKYKVKVESDLKIKKKKFLISRELHTSYTANILIYAYTTNFLIFEVENINKIFK